MSMVTGFLNPVEHSEELFPSQQQTQVESKNTCV